MNFKYLCAAVVFFIVEVLIAVFMKNNFVRGSVGDVLVVVLIYCFVKAFVSVDIKFLPAYIFIFAALVEIGQYFGLVDLLGLGGYRLARIVLGTTFDLRDIACYFAGCVGIWLFERLSKSRY